MTVGKHSFLLAAILLAALNFTATAEEVEEDLRADSPIIIEGEITAETAVSVERALRQMRYGRPKVITIDSPGGDVYAAMRIGHMLRVVKGELKASGMCYSACALIYFGAVGRVLEGELGLHRPYPYQEAGGKHRTQEEMAALYNDVAEYSRYMNIKQSVIQAMLDTPPEAMYVLTKETVERYVPSRDPADIEWKIVTRANQVGVDTATIRSRTVEARSRYKAYCEAIGEITSECRGRVTSAIIWGLSVEEYVARRDRAAQACAMTDAEVDELSDLRNAAFNAAIDQMDDAPGAEFNANELFRRRDACWQAVMGAP